MDTSACGDHPLHSLRDRNGASNNYVTTHTHTVWKLLQHRVVASVSARQERILGHQLAMSRAVQAKQPTSPPLFPVYGLWSLYISTMWRASWCSAHTHTHKHFRLLKDFRTANRTRHFNRNVSFDLCKPQEAAHFLANIWTCILNNQANKQRHSSSATTIRFLHK